eukprot:scaffold8.g1399.t1
MRGSLRGTGVRRRQAPSRQPALAVVLLLLLARPALAAAQEDWDTATAEEEPAASSDADAADDVATIDAGASTPAAGASAKTPATKEAGAAPAPAPALAAAAGEFELEARLPPFASNERDAYLCTSVQLPDRRSLKLVGVDPLSRQEVVHHMLLFGALAGTGREALGPAARAGCKSPASTDKVWNCRMASACGSGSESVLYGWGKNAPASRLPPGVGFSVGRNTAIKTLVLQARRARAACAHTSVCVCVGAACGAEIHYLDPRPKGDRSGVRLRLTPQARRPVPMSAGMVAYAASFTIPPGLPSYVVPNACCYSGFEALHGFGFRIHTHWMGRVVYLQKTNATVNAHDVASQDPQKPQARRPCGSLASLGGLARTAALAAPPLPAPPRRRACRLTLRRPPLPSPSQGFYPITPVATFLPGDRLQMACKFNSEKEGAAVSAGHTSKNEMCNMYLMVYGQLPFFMWCVDNHEWIQLDGPGGASASSRLLPEAAAWRPPAEAGAPGGPRTPVGQVSGVATALASDPPRPGAPRSVWVLHRGERTWRVESFDADNRPTDTEPIAGPTVLQLEQDSGRLLQAWAAGEHYLPHMITIDWEGNLWVTDVGLHQAIKYDQKGKRLMELGQKLTPGGGRDTLCKPTQARPPGVARRTEQSGRARTAAARVAVGRDGAIYVADGYCNARVVQYTSEGEYVREYTLAGEDPMRVPHSVIVHECRKQLLVADREGGAVHAFSLGDGGLSGSWHLSGLGLPYALTLGPYGTALALTWDREASGKVKVVQLEYPPGPPRTSWDVPGVEAPHDLALVPAPLSFTGAGERLLAVLVAETRDKGRSLLHKLVFAPRGFKPPAAVAASADGGGAGVKTEAEEGEEAEGGTSADAADEEAGGGKAGAGASPAAVQKPAGLAASHIGHAMLKPMDGDIKAAAATLAAPPAAKAGAPAPKAAAAAAGGQKGKAEGAAKDAAAAAAEEKPREDGTEQPGKEAAAVEGKQERQAAPAQQQKVEKAGEGQQAAVAVEAEEEAEEEVEQGARAEAKEEAAAAAAQARAAADKSAAAAASQRQDASRAAGTEEVEEEELEELDEAAEVEEERATATAAAAAAQQQAAERAAAPGADASWGAHGTATTAQAEGLLKQAGVTRMLTAGLGLAFVLLALVGWQRGAHWRRHGGAGYHHPTMAGSGPAHSPRHPRGVDHVA